MMYKTIENYIFIEGSFFTDFDLSRGKSRNRGQGVSQTHFNNAILRLSIRFAIKWYATLYI